MYIYLQVDPDETLASATVKNYPALTSVTGSPFSGGSLSHLGSGLWRINIGSITGYWIVHGLNSVSELLAWGYASDTYVDSSGNATTYDFPPWLSSAIVVSGVSQPGSTTIELSVNEVAAQTKQCIDSDGNAVTLTGLTLEMILEDFAGTDIQVIPSGSITISGSSWTFTPSASVTAVQKTWRWALINTANSQPLMHGLMPINYAATEGSTVVNVWDGGSP